MQDVGITIYNIIINNIIYIYIHISHTCNLCNLNKNDTIRIEILTNIGGVSIFIGYKVTKHKISTINVEISNKNA